MKISFISSQNNINTMKTLIILSSFLVLACQTEELYAQSNYYNIQESMNYDDFQRDNLDIIDQEYKIDQDTYNKSLDSIDNQTPRKNNNIDNIYDYHTSDSVRDRIPASKGGRTLQK